MRSSSTRLLVHCCIYLLLSVVAIITAGAPIRITSSTSAQTDLTGNHSQLDSSKGKCQYNLTNSSHSLEAESSTYQHRGFSQCEYIIQAPSSRFILLNFTDIRSQSDMLVESGLWRQHFQQAAAETTTPTTESTFSKIPLRKSQKDENNINSTNLHSHKVGHLVSTVTGGESKDLNPDHLKSLRNSSLFNSSISHSGQQFNTHKRDPSAHNTLSENELGQEAVRNNRSSPHKDSVRSSTVRKGSYLELSTSYRSLDQGIEAESTVSNQNCSLKLIIEEVNGTSGTIPQVICWGKSWQQRIPIVFQYSVPIRITYVWDRHSQSGFSLDFSFLRPEEVDCLFRCNNHLCLPKKQLCDGYIDCPDQSDEHNSACLLARQQEDSGEPPLIKVIVIIVSVIVGFAIVLSLTFMISHSRCQDGACWRGASLLQPPHSQSSEVCQTPSSSIQESGQYEALIQQHPQRQTATTALTLSNSHCLEHQQLLHQCQPDVEHPLQQQCHQHTRQNSCINQHYLMSQEHQIRSLSPSNPHALLPDLSQVSRQQLHPQHLQQNLVYHQQQLPEQQQRQCQQAHRHLSPGELYPPNIPLSADGEEGYAMYQKALHSKKQLERNWQVENEVFRPPPNKTVFDRDSPPPPYTLNPPGTKSLDSLVPPVGVVCVLRQTRGSLMHQGSPSGVPRSHSLSCHH